MLGPQPHGRVRSESGTQKFVSPHAQEEGGESCEKGHFLKKKKQQLWFLLKILVWLHFDFILEDFELILRTVNFLSTLFHPPRADPEFPFIPLKTCFEHLYCAFFPLLIANIPQRYSFVHRSFILKAGSAPASLTLLWGGKNPGFALSHFHF